MVLEEKTLSDLAVIRQNILDGYDGSDDQLDNLIEVERAIVAKPHESVLDCLIKKGILHEDGEPDLADLFKLRLSQSLA